MRTSQTEADEVLFIMATWVGKMELSCLLCVHKKKIPVAKKYIDWPVLFPVIFDRHQTLL